MAEEMRANFERADFPALILLMDKHFGQTHYSLKNLFRDEQQKVLNQILAVTRDEIHNTYRLITDRYGPLTRFLADIRVPPLKSLEPAMEFVLNSEIRRQFENGHADPERVRSLIAEARAAKIPFETDSLAYTVKKHFEQLSGQFLKTPDDLELLQRLSDSAGLLRVLPFEVNLWKAQNDYYVMLTAVLPKMQKRADEKNKTWIEKFRALGDKLGFHVNGNSG